MSIALWTIQSLLALFFAMAGSMKATQPMEKLAPRMGWVEDFAPRTVRLIGMLEVLGAFGIVLPALTGTLPWLTPLAAVGLVLTMAGAMLTHIRRGEYPLTGRPAVLLAFAAFVAIGRFASG